jgi:4-aminobutyrate aminotransferase-like enzyme
MAKNCASPLKPLLDSPPVREAARAPIAAVAEEADERALSPHAYERALRRLERQRGREIVFPAGAKPTEFRMPLPMNTTDEEIETGFTILEKALTRVAEEGLPC